MHIGSLRCCLPVQTADSVRVKRPLAVTSA